MKIGYKFHVFIFYNFSPRNNPSKSVTVGPGCFIVLDNSASLKMVRKIFFVFLKELFEYRRDDSYMTANKKFVPFAHLYLCLRRNTFGIQQISRTNILSVSLHREKYTSTEIYNRNHIVHTIFRLILDRIEFHLLQNPSDHKKDIQVFSMKNTDIQTVASDCQSNLFGRYHKYRI